MGNQPAVPNGGCGRMNYQECPVCENTDTDHHGITGTAKDIIDVTLTCSECVTQFTVTFSAEEKTVDVSETIDE